MARVIVIGGANVDIKGRASEHFIAGTSNPGEVTVSAGCVGRNIAENLARLGIDVSLVTALGRDQNGIVLRQACAAAGIDLSLAVEVEEATGTYLAVLDETGEMVSAVSDMRAIDRLAPSGLAAAAARLGDADLLVADCNIPAACLEWLCAFSAEAGVPLLIEPVSVPKARKLLAFARAVPVFAVTPNTRQLDALAGGDIPRLHATGFQNVVVHQGGEGAIASNGSAMVRIPPQAISTVADVTGAGDAAVAGLVCGLIDGLSLADSARLGQCAAAIKLSSSHSVAEGLSRDSLYRRSASLPGLRS